MPSAGLEIAISSSQTVAHLRLSSYGHRNWQGSYEKQYIYIYIYICMYVFVNSSWVQTRWQQYSTHLHINNTQNNTMKQNITHK